MRKVLHLLLLSLLISISFKAQTKDESWKVFDDSQVAQVSVTMNSFDYTRLYANPHSDSVYKCIIKFKNKFIDTTFTNAGIAIRGNTSRDAKKKSIKISLNEFEKGKDLFGIQKLNINGEHNDPSIFRSKMCWDLFRTIGLTGSRAAHTTLYINGVYLGIYISVEMIDEEFIKKNYTDNSGNLWKCLYPADLVYKGSDPNVYKYRPSYTAYELTTNETLNDYSKLAKLIDVLNNTNLGLLPDSLEKILDVANYLKYHAMDVLVGQWDDYMSNMNNYYFYYEPTEKKFHIIPYDYDNTFGVTWIDYDWTKSDPYNFRKINPGSRPLADRLMTITKYRDLYTHFLKFYTGNVFKLGKWNENIERIKALIYPYALLDNYKGKDYGFTIFDFDNSYSETGYSNKHVKKGIKQYMNERSADIIPKLAYTGSGPIVYKIETSPVKPGPNDSIHVYVSGFGTSGIERINIKFHPGMLTVIYDYKMKYSPVTAATKVEEADRWIGVIPPLGKNGYGKFSIEIKDLAGVTAAYPLSGLINVNASAGFSTDASNVVINEFLAENVKTIKDPANRDKDEFDDWLELYNPTNREIVLTGMYLSDSKSDPTQWQFKDAGAVIKPNEHIIVWCDDQSSQPGYHTNFKLSKSGEYLSIVDKDGKTVIDEITFDAQSTDISYGRYPDGGNNWGKMVPTPGNSNGPITAIEKRIGMSEEFRLYQNYPNPFNPTTTINFSIPKNCFVTLTLYSVIGKEVALLVNENKFAGNYRVEFDAGKLTSGIYFYQLKAGNYIETKKLVLLK